MHMRRPHHHRPLRREGPLHLHAGMWTALAAIGVCSALAVVAVGTLEETRASGCRSSEARRGGDSSIPTPRLSLMRAGVLAPSGRGATREWIVWTGMVWKGAGEQASARAGFKVRAWARVVFLQRMSYRSASREDG